MAQIPDDKVQEVRDRVDIVDLVGRYVELKRSGKNFKGLCPFHHERTPSFNVNPARQGYKCFGCGAGGDGIRFVMEVDGRSFPEAVRKLAELYGVQLPAGVADGMGQGGPDRSERDDAYAMMRRTVETYREILLSKPEGEAGRRYLEQRGIDEATSAAFMLGYAPAPAEAGWDRLAQTLRAAGLSTELGVRLGLLVERERGRTAYDRFRGRLMFPVGQPGGETVALSARIVPPHDTADDDNPPPKYLNSPDSLLARKGKLLFGLVQARRTIAARRRVLLVEGNIDVVRLHQWGFSEAVAPMGTALTEDQAALVARFTDQVVLCFDGDQAGKKAAWKALPILLAADLDVRLALLPEGFDPDSLGPERFGGLLEHAQPALPELMNRIAVRAGAALDARAQALDRVVPLMAKVPRETARGLYADRAAELFGMPRARVEAAVEAQRHRAEAPSPSREGARHSGREGDRPGGGPHGRSVREGEDRPVSSQSGRLVPVSAAVPGTSQVPAAQADLTMLLVDAPHLAALARREGALGVVTDDRLAPVVAAAVDGAESGRTLSTDELLATVDPEHHELLWRTVLAGRYRPDASPPEDPATFLRELVRRCLEDALHVEVATVERELRVAQREGDLPRATELVQTKLELRKRQAALRQGQSLPVEAPSINRGPSP